MSEFDNAAIDSTTLIAGRDTRWYRGHLGKLNIMIFLVIITSMTNGYDGSMMNGLQTITVWQEYFNYPSGGLLGVFNAIQYIGAIAALPFCAYVSDTLGRRKAIALGSVIMLVGVAVQTSSTSVGQFIGGRFCIGYGLTFATNAAPALITELAYPTHRAPLTALYNSSWYLGAIVAAWTTYGTFPIPNQWSWRIPSLVQALPSVIQICCIWFIPESPRWLVAQGRDEEAKRIFARHHCGGDHTDPLVEFEYQEIVQALELQKVQKSSTWKSLWATRGNLKRMRIIIAIGFFSQWSGNGLVSYYLHDVLNSIGITLASQQALLNGILQLYNYATAIIGSLTVDKAGRRTLFLTSTIGMTICFAIWTACSAVYANSPPTDPNKNAGNAVVAMIFLYYGFYNIAMSPLLAAYTAEILPFAIRTKGLVVSSLTVDAALVFNQYLNPIALDALAWKYYLVYCVWLAAETVMIYFWVLETKNGKTLEEISMIFDGEEAVASIKARTVNAVSQAEKDDGATVMPYQGQATFSADSKGKGEDVTHQEIV